MTPEHRETLREAAHQLDDLAAICRHQQDWAGMSEARESAAALRAMAEEKEG